MKKYAPVIFILIFFSLRCTGGISKNEIVRNEKIESKLKADMDKYAKQVLGYMSENNYQLLSQLFSDSLQQNINAEFSQKFLPQIQKVIKGRDYKIIDQFYIKSVRPRDSVKILAGKGDNAYELKCNNQTNETFITLLVTNDSLNEVMLTLIWAKWNGKWKVNNILGDDYSLNKKNAIEQYTYARQLQQDGDLIDAVNVMALCNHCMKPAGKMFKYAISEKIAAYTDSLTAITKTKYPFPYTVGLLAGKPIIFNIHYEIMDQHFTPMIMYKTSVSVTDTAKLRSENTEMQKNIGTLFTGIDKNNKVLLYRAYNEQPDNQTNPRYWGFVQRL